MTNDFGTKDVVDQLTARLGNVEQGVRQLHSGLEQVRSELRAEIGRVHSELRAEMATRFAEVDQRFGRMESRFDQLQAQLLADRRMLLGILVASWLSTLVSIWIKG